MSELTWGGSSGTASELLRINDCSDVRARDLTLNAPTGTVGTRVLNSRFEGSDCRITGGRGSGEQCGVAEDGYAAMLALQSSQVLLSQSTLTGGDGGWNTNTCGTSCLNGTVTIRRRGTREQETVSFDAFVELIEGLRASRSMELQR
ncbi:MAG: His/Gly/Thr/Pro-type tRNA ligase C-terminal domain-containing protein [Planctomycetota bacterium]